MPKVDVIVPAYNNARYLAAAIESVLAQTFTDWRILLVDDGSTDNTAEVVEPYLQSHGVKIRYIRQDNRGVSAARNAAIRASDSALIALLDADDVWFPQRLEESVKAMDANPAAGLSYGRITYLNADGCPGTTWGGNLKHAEGRVASAIYTRKIDLPSPTITVRRKALDQVGLFDETMRATEDRDLWLRIALRYEVAFVPKVISYYRIWGSSASSSQDHMMSGQLRFIRKHYGAEGCGWLPRQIALAYVYNTRAYALKSKGKLGKALLNALCAVAIYPFDLGNTRTAASLGLAWLRGRS